MNNTFLNITATETDGRKENQRLWRGGKKFSEWAAVSLSYLDIWLPGWESSVPSWKETQTRVTQTVEQTHQKCWWLSRLNIKGDSGLQHFHFIQRELCKPEGKKKHLLLKTFNTWNLIMYSATTCRVQCVTCSDTQDNQVNCVLTPTRQTQQMMSNLLLWCFNMQGSAVQSAVMFKGIFRCKFNPSNTLWHEIKFAGC